MTPRDHTVVSYLPTLLQVETDILSAAARIMAYKAACARTEWSNTDTSAEQTRAYHTICARVMSAYNRLDLGPTDREKMASKMRRLQMESVAKDTVIQRQAERIQHLEDAVVRLTAERGTVA